MNASMQQIHGVTSNYFFWQGLRFVPFGPSLIAAGLGLLRPTWWPLKDYSDWLTLGLLAAGFVGFKLVSDYYNRSFGSVRGIPGAHRQRELIKWLVVYPAMGIAPFVDYWIKAPVAISGLVWAASSVAYWQSTGGGRSHYLWLAMALAGLSFAPLAGLVKPGVEVIGLLLAALGLLYMIAGTFDHLELVRLMGSVKDDGDDDPA